MSTQAAIENKISHPGLQPASATNPDEWLDAHGNVLFAFALARVRDRAAAQDVVQETFLAALKARQSFAGRSGERAWLFGILRNKLADYYRTKSKETAFEFSEALGEENERFFHGHGPGKDGWISRVAPKRWAEPDASLISKEFQQVFEDCLSKLPERMAQVFIRREVDEVSTDELCKDLGISSDYTWVILHRARMSLRRCLEVHWFGPDPLRSPNYGTRESTDKRRES